MSILDLKAQYEKELLAATLKFLDGVNEQNPKHFRFNPVLECIEHRDSEGSTYMLTECRVEVTLG